MQRSRLALCTLALALTLAALAGCTSPPPPAPAPIVLPPATHETIRFETDAGPIVIMLYPEAAPKTVQMMKDFVTQGYYNGRAFYRIVPGHVIQITDAG